MSGSFLNICMSGFHPDSSYGDPTGPFRMHPNCPYVTELKIKDILEQVKIISKKKNEEQNTQDKKIKLGPNALNALRECQRYIRKLLTMPGTDELFDELLLELDHKELVQVCMLVDRQKGEKKGILLRHDHDSSMIHLFHGEGKTVCGKQTGTVGYLIGEKTYCRECLTTEF